MGLLTLEQTLPFTWWSHRYIQETPPIIYRRSMRHDSTNRLWQHGVSPPTRTAFFSFFFQEEDDIRDLTVTGVQTCALPILLRPVRLAEPQQGKRRHPIAPHHLGECARRVSVALFFSIRRPRRKRAEETEHFFAERGRHR